jgi:oligosaccharide repeat unit polymerase
MKTAIKRGEPAPRTKVATAVTLVGLAVTYVSLPSTDAVQIFWTAAVGVGLTIAIGTVAEAFAGVRALIRVDLLMLWVLYGLTFLEFLFPQQGIDTALSAEAANFGTAVALLGFAGLAVGRHLVPRNPGGSPAAAVNAEPRQIFYLFVLAAVFGYLYMLIAVNFDPLELLREMAWPRFSQAWTRGRYGDNVYVLLVEVGALVYLIPPLAGLVYARSWEYGIVQRTFVTLILLLTIYNGIASGTRNVIAVHVFTFFGAYYLNKQSISWTRILIQGGLSILALLIVTEYMLEFRNRGLDNFSFTNDAPTTLYVDHNMVVLSTLTAAFPAQHEFLGLEIPYVGLIHPIPRVLWPGKPDGLSVSVESIVGTDQATIACTFIGEAYMSGGILAVILASLGFGAAAEMWNRVGRKSNSGFSQVLYASGFFCAAITMRSSMWMTVTMLPSIGLWCYGKMFIRSRRATRVA